MLSPGGRHGTDRAVATTLGYALSLGITSLLITGLLFGGGTFVEDQRDRAVRSELEVTGQQVAGAIGSADRLVWGLDDGGSVTVRRSLPERTAGSGYRFDVERVGHRDVYELTLRSFDPELSIQVRTYSEAPVYAPAAVDGGEIVVQSNDALMPKLFVTRPGADPAFVERSGQVVLEAEGPLTTAGGANTESEHYWEVFRDADASGGRAIVSRPNESSGYASDGNTADEPDGPRLDYPVRFTQAGTYLVCARLREPPTESDDSNSFHVGLDGTIASTGGNGLGVDSSAPHEWTWEHEVEGGGDVELSIPSPGTYTVNLWMREDGTQVDKLVLRTSGTCPSGSDTGPSAF